jgi:hypothetical protein
MIYRRMMLIAAVASLAATLSAQTTPQPLLVQVARVNVKPDRVSEWLDIEKQYSEAYKKGGGTFRYVYRNSAGNPFEYMVTSGVGNYASLDEKTPYAKGMTEGELARLSARRNQCVDSVRTTYERTIPELGIQAPAGSVRKIIRVTRNTVRSGMDDQFLAIMKNEYLPAHKKAGVTSLLVRRVEWGGSRNVFTLLGRHDKFAELDEGSRLTKALGAEAAEKLLAKLRQTIANTDYSLYTYVPGSSYQPPPAQ